MNDKTRDSRQEDNPTILNDELGRILGGEVPEDPREIEKLLGVEIPTRGVSNEGAASAAGGDDGAGVLTDEQKAQADKDAKDAADAAAKAAEDAAGKEAANKDKSKDDPAKTGDTDAAKAAEDKGAAAPAGEKIDGILTRDGKRVIPYSVLEQQRAEAVALRKENQELKAKQKTDLEKAGIDTSAAAEGGELPVLSEAQLADLRKTFPKELVETIETQQKAMLHLSGTVKQLAEQDEARRAQDDEVRAQLLQEDIDAVPGLAKLQADALSESASDDAIAKWEAAKALDRALMTSDSWRAKSRLERFEHVARSLGLEVEKAPPADPGAKGPAGDKQPPNKDTKTAAAGAKGKTPAPASISDIPGGAAPPSSELAGIESSSTVELDARMKNMTPSQIGDFLARL